MEAIDDEDVEMDYKPEDERIIRGEEHSRLVEMQNINMIAQLVNGDTNPDVNHEPDT